MDLARKEIRPLVRGGYDLQMLRIQMGNRIVANFKVKAGQEPGKKEDSTSVEGQRIIKLYRDSFKTISDVVAHNPRGTNRPGMGFEGDKVISNWTEWMLAKQYIELHALEDENFKKVKIVLNDYPIWTEYLEGVWGVAERMAGVIISEFDIHRARYVSSMWKYAGLDVAPDGIGRSNKTNHLIDVEYISRGGKKEMRKSITYNPFLKTKLMGVLAPSFVMGVIKNEDDEIVGYKTPYRKIYDDYKHRLHNREDFVHEGKGRDGHIDMAAKRYMIKMFLQDLYDAWKDLEGLPRANNYYEAKLGKKHSG